MEDRITVIEGPTPVFEPVQEVWALGLNEGPARMVMAQTRLRTFNGRALVERCYRQWKNHQPIKLHYRNELGLEEQAPIVAARSVDTEEGQVLLLWLNFDEEKVEIEYDVDDADEDDYSDE